LGKKLDSAVHLVRLQRQLLDSQRVLITEHRRALALALEMLANVTAAVEIGDFVPWVSTPMDLKI
jgi:hypothetical protein